MPLRDSSHPGSPVVLPLHGTVVGRNYLPEASPWSEPGSLARQRWHATATPLSQQILYNIYAWNFFIRIFLSTGRFPSSQSIIYLEMSYQWERIWLFFINLSNTWCSEMISTSKRYKHNCVLLGAEPMKKTLLKFMTMAFSYVYTRQ